VAQRLRGSSRRRLESNYTAECRVFGPVGRFPVHADARSFVLVHRWHCSRTHGVTPGVAWQGTCTVGRSQWSAGARCAAWTTYGVLFAPIPVIPTTHPRETAPSLVGPRRHRIRFMLRRLAGRVPLLATSMPGARCALAAPGCRAPPGLRTNLAGVVTSTTAERSTATSATAPKVGCGDPTRQV